MGEVCQISEYQGPVTAEQMIKMGRMTIEEVMQAAAEMNKHQQVTQWGWANRPNSNGHRCF